MYATQLATDFLNTLVAFLAGSAAGAISAWLTVRHLAKEAEMTDRGPKAMSHLYTLNDAGQPERAEYLLEWAAWIETADLRIFNTKINDDIEVSTVFLGIDTSFGLTDQPRLWETMIFGGPDDMNQWRYTGRDAALAHHDQLAAEQQAKLATQHYQGDPRRHPLTCTHIYVVLYQVKIARGLKTPGRHSRHAHACPDLPDLACVSALPRCGMVCPALLVRNLTYIRYAMVSYYPYAQQQAPCAARAASHAARRTSTHAHVSICAGKSLVTGG